MNTKEALIDLREGLQSKYPLCCILQFCLDSFLGKTRKQIYRYVRQLEYVPCSLHMKAYQRTTKKIKQQLEEDAGIDLKFVSNNEFYVRESK